MSQDRHRIAASRLPIPPVVALDELRVIKLFANAENTLLETFVRRCAWRRFDAEQCIVSRQAADRDVYFVMRGVVRVVAFSAAGKQLTYRDLQRGEWFGDLSAIDRHPRSADVYACCETLVASLGAQDFLELVHASATVADALLEHLAALVRDLSARLFDLSALGVRNRVRAELLRLAREAGVHANSASLCPAPRHSDIASRVSTYREQVTRELSALAKCGIVERQGGALVVRDVSRLAVLVEQTREGA